MRAPVPVPAGVPLPSVPHPPPSPIPPADIPRRIGDHPAMRILTTTFTLLLTIALAITGCCGAEQARLEAENAELQLQMAAEELAVEQARKELAECEEQVAVHLAEIEALERAAAPPSWGGGRIGQPGPESPIRCASVDDHYTVDPTVGEDLSQLSMSMRVVPHYRDGKAHGMKLYGIPSDSLPGSCGFRNGDVITALNDLPLTSPGEALGAYAAVSEANEAVFTVERREETISIRIVGLADDDE